MRGSDRRSATAGFTLVELVVAILVLGTGVLLLAGGSMFVTRDLQGGRQASRAAAQAEARMDMLRVAATATDSPCSGYAFRSSSAPVTRAGVTVSWTVPTSGTVRTIRVITTYQTAAGRTRTDTLLGAVAC